MPLIWKVRPELDPPPSIFDKPDGSVEKLLDPDNDRNWVLQATSMSVVVSRLNSRG
jgi:hypothetical protein